jgi:CRP/FNR family transcriptional regulator, cyclic AMP receptor protein
MMRSTPVEVLQPLFADLTKREVQKIARLFKERRVSRGETVVKEGSGGATFFVIESGEATVFIDGKERATLKHGDYFGEIALIDEGARMVTITASTELVCYGLTYWDFRPLVEKNGVVGWKLLQQMAKMLRATRQEAHELENALAVLRTHLTWLLSSPPRRSLPSWALIVYVQYALVIPFIEAMRSHAPKIRLANVLLVSAPLMR